jgi:hypothetical protein
MAELLVGLRCGCDVHQRKAHAMSQTASSEPKRAISRREIPRAARSRGEFHDISWEEDTGKLALAHATQSRRGLPNPGAMKHFAYP